MYKDFNSTCITLVAFFDPKHFLAENRARKSIYFLTPNTQYDVMGHSYDHSSLAFNMAHLTMHPVPISSLSQPYTNSVTYYAQLIL